MDKLRDMLGKVAKDKVTGLEGVITGVSVWLYGCDQVLLLPKSKDNEPSKSQWYDAPRIEILDEPGIEPESVQGDKPGGPSRAPTSPGH